GLAGHAFAEARRQLLDLLLDDRHVNSPGLRRNGLGCLAHKPALSSKMLHGSLPRTRAAAALLAMMSSAPTSADPFPCSSVLRQDAAARACRRVPWPGRSP